MRLLTYREGNVDRAGVLARDGTVVDAARLIGRDGLAVLEILDAGALTLGPLAKAAAGAKGGIPLANARLRAPIPRTRRNVFCVGWNYSEHFAEGQAARGPGGSADLPSHPSFFTKNPGTIVGPEEPVRLPAPHSEQLDFEVELAVVIGRGGRDISQARALEHVFGYTVANDVSVRDVQRRHGGQWFKGKNFDTHLPMGPWIVTSDEIADPQALHITSRVNGETKQDSNTKHMVFSVARIVAELSAGMALEPGDVIITGTPEGVGFARTPPEFLRSGDLMEMEIEGIGVLRNPVGQAPARA